MCIRDRTVPMHRRCAGTGTRNHPTARRSGPPGAPGHAGACLLYTSIAPSNVLIAARPKPSTTPYTAPAAMPASDAGSTPLATITTCTAANASQPVPCSARAHRNAARIPSARSASAAPETRLAPSTNIASTAAATTLIGIARSLTRSLRLLDAAVRCRCHRANHSASGQDGAADSATTSPTRQDRR